MKDRFDYIIVGGGSAGCVLANRLSESPTNSVLLIEAGTRDWHPLIHIPVGYAYNLKRPAFNWMYETEPEPGAADRRIFWPRGKVLGGSSALNGMINVRGQSADYDHWRQLGNGGWSWDDVLPFFRNLESFSGGTDDARGRTGPLPVAKVPQHEVSDAFLAALSEMGFDERDTNDGDQDGYAYVEATIRNGLRQSAAVAYLNPAKQRPNLTIATSAHAEKILFKGRRAVGVSYRHKGRLREALAAREVVISGGAINSPQLLELSGIGRHEVLQAAGIPVLHESRNVGENLQDHYSAFCAYRVTQPVTINELTHGFPLIKELMKFAFARSGVLTFSPAHVLAYVRSRPDLPTPDIQVCMLPATIDTETNALEADPGMTCAPYQLRPESRGTIHIKSADAREHPRIHANYLQAALDQQTIVAGLRISRTICEQSALAAYRGQELLPGRELQTDDELLAYARETGSTLYHPTSTCRMGSDPEAVVDTRLRVIGVAGLRVVDASVMPTLISGNTNTPTIMIAEKAARMILEDAKSALRDAVSA